MRMVSQSSILAPWASSILKPWGPITHSRASTYARQSLSPHKVRGGGIILKTKNPPVQPSLLSAQAGIYIFAPTKCLAPFAYLEANPTQTCFRIHPVQSVVNNVAQLSGRGFPHIFHMELFLSQFYVFWYFKMDARPCNLNKHIIYNFDFLKFQIVVFRILKF